MVYNQLAFNTVDYLLLLILVLCALSGARQGFINSLGSVTAFIASLVLAVFFYDDLAISLERYVGLISSLDNFMREHAPLRVLGIPYALLVKGYNIYDSVNYLAFWFVRAACFLIIALTSRQLIWLVLGWFEDAVTTPGSTAAVNKLMGMALAMAQGVIVITLLALFTLPVLRALAQMGGDGALALLAGLNHSVIISRMMELYQWGYSALGLKV